MLNVLFTIYIIWHVHLIQCQQILLTYLLTYNRRRRRSSAAPWWVTLSIRPFCRSHGNR